MDKITKIIKNTTEENQELDAMLVLKDILAHEYLDKKKK